MSSETIRQVGPYRLIKFGPGSVGYRFASDADGSLTPIDTGCEGAENAETYLAMSESEFVETAAGELSLFDSDPDHLARHEPELYTALTANADAFDSYMRSLRCPASDSKLSPVARQAWRDALLEARDLGPFADNRTEPATLDSGPLPAFMFQADLHCENCTESIKDSLHSPAGADDESSYDSDQYPKGPYADAGGESDSPQHCGTCGVFMGAPLTDHGLAYVAEKLEPVRVMAGGRPGCESWADLVARASLIRPSLGMWATYYESDLAEWLERRKESDAVTVR